MASQASLIKIDRPCRMLAEAAASEGPHTKIVSRLAAAAEEAERVHAVHALRIMDTPPEPAFDALTAVSRALLDVPVSFIVLIDETRAWAKSTSGQHAGRGCAPREDTFCNLVVRQKAPLVIEDAAADPVYRDNPYVSGASGFRFYVGVPLTTSTGHVIGALCGFDHRPRSAPDGSRIEQLQHLATSLVATLELRASEATLRETERALSAQTALLQTILDGVDQGITAFDADLRLAAWNRRAAEMMDLPAEMLVQGAEYEGFARLRARRGSYGPGDPDELARVRTERMRGFEAFCQDEVTSDGRVVALRVVPLPGGGLVATHTDVTEERRRAAELQDRAKRFEIQERVASLANQATSLDGALAELLALVCTHTNSSLGCIRRIDGEELAETGIRHVELAHEDSSETVTILDGPSFVAREAALTGQGAHGEVQLPDGTLAAVFAFPLVVMSHAFIVETFGQTRLFSKDWHVLVRGYMENQLTQVVQRERAERLKNEFVATVSHELRTPLTPLLGMLELLEAGVFGALPEEAKQPLEIACQNGRRLARIVEDILLLEACKSSKAPSDRDVCLLAPLVAESVSSLEAAADGRTIEVAADVGCEGLTVAADSKMVVEILKRLLSNALRFSDDVVTVATSRHQEWARISVIDRGVGIAPEFRTRIFEQFAQADGSDTRRADGVGLGLAIVKQFATAIGAQVSFETSQNQGTAFHLDLLPAERDGSSEMPVSASYN